MREYLHVDDDRIVDDVVLKAVSVHIEDLGDRIWIAVNRADGDRFTFEVHTRRGRGQVECRVVESAIGSLE